MCNVFIYCIKIFNIINLCAGALASMLLCDYLLQSAKDPPQRGKGGDVQGNDNDRVDPHGNDLTATSATKLSDLSDDPPQRGKGGAVQGNDNGRVDPQVSHVAMLSDLTATSAAMLSDLSDHPPQKGKGGAVQGNDNDRVDPQGNDNGPLLYKTTCGRIAICAGNVLTLTRRCSSGTCSCLRTLAGHGVAVTWKVFSGLAYYFKGGPAAEPISKGCRTKSAVKKNTKLHTARSENTLMPLLLKRGQQWIADLKAYNKRRLRRRWVGNASTLDYAAGALLCAGRAIAGLIAFACTCILLTRKIEGS